jgi:hypothetical protein
MEHWDETPASHLPMALRTTRNLERDGGGPFHLRPGQNKKIPLCARVDGASSDIQFHFETDDYRLGEIDNCEVEVNFYGAGAPTVERFDLRVNDNGELKVTRHVKARA